MDLSTLQTLLQKTDISIRSNAKLFDNIKASLSADIKSHSIQIEQGTSNHILYSESLPILKLVTDSLVNEGKAALEALVTQALNTVFSEKYQFKIEVQPDSKRAVPSLIDPRSGAQVSLDSAGGGIATLCEITIGVYLIIRFNRQRLLILDESLVAVSAQYVPAVSQFLKALTEDPFNFTIILISHQPLFAQQATHNYELSRSSEGHLQIARQS